MTKIILVRHGETKWNLLGRYQGQTDVALSPLGIEQAEKLAAHFPVDKIEAVYSSDLARAMKTASCVADRFGLTVEPRPELRELNFGDWEGLTFLEAAERDPDLHRRWLRDTGLRPPGGESFDEVQSRIERARDRIIAEHGSSTVLVVSHVTPIKTLLRLALGAGTSILHRLHLDLASLSIAEFYPDNGTSVRLVNDTSYLSG